MPEKVVKPGQVHGLNLPPHFNTISEIKLDKTHLSPVVLELRDGRRVKVYPLNGAWVKLDAPNKGFYSHLLIDEVAERDRKFKSASGASLLRELSKLLERDHGLHPARFDEYFR